MAQKWAINHYGTSCASSDVEVITVTSKARMHMSVNVYQDWIVGMKSAIARLPTLLSKTISPTKGGEYA
jgi:hypothetical protein